MKITLGLQRVCGKPGKIAIRLTYDIPMHPMHKAMPVYAVEDLTLLYVIIYRSRYYRKPGEIMRDQNESGTLNPVAGKQFLQHLREDACDTELYKYILDVIG